MEHSKYIQAMRKVASDFDGVSHKHLLWLTDQFR